MQNLNNFLNDLQNWYNAKYNGETNLPKIGKIAEKHGFEYVKGRYLVVDGEKIRLDKLCKQNGIECNYTSTVNHSTNGETHTITAVLRGKKAKKTRFTSKRNMLRTIINRSNGETQRKAYETLFNMQRSQREKVAFEAKQAAKAAKQAALQAYEAKLKSMKKDALLKLLMNQKAVAL